MLWSIVTVLVDIMLVVFVFCLLVDLFTRRSP